MPPQPEGGVAGLMKSVVYPENAKLDKIEGKVVVQVHVGIDGRIDKTNILEGMPGSGFDEAVIAAVEESRWIPAKKDGETVAVWVAIPFIFKLQ